MKKALIFLFVTGALVAAWLWFRQPTADTADDARQPAIAQVVTTPLKTQVIARTISAFGVVAASPSGDQVIVAPFDCIILKVLVVPGSRVAAGDVLLEITPTPDTKLQFDLARSALALAAKALAATQERYDLKLANSQELLAAQQAESDARQKLASFENRRLGADGKVAAASAGIVSKLDLSAGALAPAGTALIAVTTEYELEARLGVEPSDATQIIARQPATLISAGRPDAQPILSAVRVAGRILDAVTGAAEVRVPVPAGAPLLLGEHVKAAIQVGEKEAFVVPRSAVLLAEGKYVLYTVKNNRAVLHEVTPGISADALTEVTGKDLHDGDMIVTLGNYELSDGMAVQEKATGAEAKPSVESGESPREARP